MYARDTQKQRVYDWERLLPDHAQELPLDEVRQLVAEVFRLYGDTSPPVVKDGRRTRVARGGVSYLNLPKWARTPRTILHECAHSLQLRRTSRYAFHGPEFVAIFLDLYDRFIDSGLKRSALSRLARAAGVRVKHGEIAPKPKVLMRVTSYRVTRGHGRVPLVPETIAARRRPAERQDVAVRVLPKVERGAWEWSKCANAQQVRALRIAAMLRERGYEADVVEQTSHISSWQDGKTTEYDREEWVIVARNVTPTQAERAKNFTYSNDVFRSVFVEWYARFPLPYNTEA